MPTGGISGSSLSGSPKAIGLKCVCVCVGGGWILSQQQLGKEDAVFVSSLQSKWQFTIFGPLPKDTWAIRGEHGISSQSTESSRLGGMEGHSPEPSSFVLERAVSWHSWPSTHSYPLTCRKTYLGRCFGHWSCLSQLYLGNPDSKVQNCLIPSLSLVTEGEWDARGQWGFLGFLVKSLLMSSLAQTLFCFYITSLKTFLEWI